WHAPRNRGIEVSIRTTAERCAGACDGGALSRAIVVSTNEVSRKSVLKKNRFVKVDTANEVVALTTDITNFESGLESDFALDSEVPLMRGRVFKIRIDRENSSEVDARKRIAGGETAWNSESRCINLEERTT